AQACTSASASSSTASRAGSRSRSPPGCSAPPARARSSSPARSRTWSRAAASRSRIEASASSRACRTSGASAWSPRQAKTSPIGLRLVAPPRVGDTTGIAALSGLADLPAEELDELAAAMTEVDVRAGAEIVTADDYGTAIYFVEEGQADVVDEHGQTIRSL